MASQIHVSDGQYSGETTSENIDTNVVYTAASFELCEKVSLDERLVNSVTKLRTIQPLGNEFHQCNDADIKAESCSG